MIPFETLILLFNCPDCTKLKMNFDFTKVFEDKIVGKNGCMLFLYYAFSNLGLKELLNKYGIKEDKAPVLIKSNGEILSDISQLIDYMKANY